MQRHDEFPRPWLPPGRGRTLRACSRAQRDALLARLRDASSDWARSWGLEPQAVQLACADVPAVAEGDAWSALCADDGAAVAWLQGPGHPGLLQHLLPGARSLGLLGPAVCESCAADAAMRLAAALGLRWDSASQASPPAAEARPWSGALRIDMALAAGSADAAHGWRLVLGGDAVAGWCSRTGHARRAAAPGRPRAVLVTATQALATTRMRLQAGLDGCEIDLGTLRALAPGDVVRLRHALTAPARLEDHRGRPCLAGYLVRHAGHRALELAGPAEDLPTTRRTS